VGAAYTDWNMGEKRMKEYVVNMDGIKEMEGHLDVRIYVLNVILQKIRYNLLGKFTAEEIEGWIVDVLGEETTKVLMQELFDFKILLEVQVPQGNTLEVHKKPTFQDDLEGAK
jgi:hypothetical protein